MCWQMLLLAAFSLVVQTIPAPSAFPELDKRVTRLLAEAGPHIAAFSAVAVRDGQVAWQFVSGMADYNKSEPVTPTTRFMWASVSKTVVAYAAMLLVDRGFLSLDEDISAVVGFAVRHPHFPETAVTLRMLMTHTAAINDAQDYLVLPATCVRGDTLLSNEEWLSEYLRPGGRYFGGVGGEHHGSWLRHAPGRTYQYSNEGASLAALAAEKAAQRAGLIRANESVSDLARRHVFPAFGVTAPDAVSYFLRDLPSGPSAVQRPSAYYPGWPGLRGLEEYFVYDYPEYPCGRWEASPRSQAGLLLNLIGNGTSRGLPPLLSASTVAEMKRPQDIVRPQPQNPQGLIFYYEQQGGRTLLGHDGCDWGTATDMFYNPVTGVGYVVATSSDCENAKAYEPLERIEIAILDALEEDRLVDRGGPIARRRRRPGPRQRAARRSSELALIGGGGGRDPCKDASLPKPCWWLCADLGEHVDNSTIYV